MISRTLLVLLGTIVAITLGEITLRLRYPQPQYPAADEYPWFSSDPNFIADTEMGYRPVLGKIFDEYGFLKEYASPPGDKTIVTVGDSVTARGKVLRALQKQPFETRYQFLNAGVESFNTVQEIIFYERYNRKVKPDIALQFFHNNDFVATPVAFYDQKGLRVLTPYYPLSGIEAYFFIHSRLYQLFEHTRVRKIDTWEERVQQTRQALARMKELTQADNTKYFIVLLPLVAPYTSWPKEAKRSRETSITLFNELGIPFIDPFEETEALQKNGVNLMNIQGDTAHPNDIAAEVIAKKIFDSGKL